MKQFFAKFIVINDDNIKDGDYYLFDGKIQRCVKSIIPELKELYGEKWDSNWFKIVKLCICSRVTNNIKTDIDQQQWQEMSRQEKDEHLLKTDQYKIIGEISPQAKWVKEGDKFTEKEFAKMAILGDDHFVPWIEGREELGYEMIIKIKCPCCEDYK